MVKKITKNHILNLFCNDYSRAFYLREIASLIETSHQGLYPYLDQLIKENILKKNKRKNLTEFSLNLSNPLVFEYLIMSEKQRLLSRLSEDMYLKILYEKLSSFFSQATFVLFGSAVENVRKGSDIDLLVIGSCDCKDILNDYSDIYNKPIHVITIPDILSIDTTFLKEIFQKHLIFNNTELLVRFFGDCYGQNRLV